MLAHDGVAPLERSEVDALDRVADEKDRVTRVERILDERGQQLPLPFAPAASTAPPSPCIRLREAESWVTLLLRLVALRHRLGIELEQRVAQPLHEPAMHDPDTGFPSGARE